MIEAVDGEDAMKILSANYQDIKITLLDWQMPKMDGMEFMRAVVGVEDVSHIPIVMVTASGSEEAQKCARRVNLNLAGYVVKPDEPDVLLNEVKSYLDSRSG
ncbi:MAG: CheY-like chemotaxis protein [Lysobacterales bacterium]|jgi:CheY-like chemotaxis protein